VTGCVNGPARVAAPDDGVPLVCRRPPNRQHGATLIFVWPGARRFLGPRRCLRSLALLMLSERVHFSLSVCGGDNPGVLPRSVIDRKAPIHEPAAANTTYCHFLV
jgi:hypothetical protein